MTPMIPLAEKLFPLLSRAGVRGDLYLFGSWARGTAGRTSDIDLLVEAPSALPLTVLAHLEVLLSESDLPYTVDLVEAKRADPSFLAAIRPDCLKIAEL